MRIRSAVILIQNESLALIERHRAGHHYFSFPGGGVDEGETPEQTAVREAFEELGMEVRVIRLAVEVWFRGKQQLFYLVEQVGGEFGTGTGEEYELGRDPIHGTHKPIWMPLADVTVKHVLPKPVAALVAQSHPSNWPDDPIVIMEEP